MRIMRKITSARGRFTKAFPLSKLRTVRPMFFYMISYLVCFGLIEQWNRLHYTVIHTVVDDMIPFSPVFVIPYVLWFPYVTVFVLFLLMKNEEAYHKLCTTLAIGMTVFIIVSIIYPNIHLLRPETMPVDNVFTRMISRLYLVDTPTNLTPSIHVFNSLAIIAAGWNWNWETEDGQVYSNKTRVLCRILLTVIGVMITLSTMLIKQHSFSDVVIAIALYMVTYFLVYRLDFVFIGGKRVRRPALRPRSARS